MVVALGALQSGSEEYPYRVGHIIQGHASIANVVTDGSRVPRFSFGGE